MRLSGACTNSYQGTKTNVAKHLTKTLQFTIIFTSFSRYIAYLFLHQPTTFCLCNLPRGSFHLPGSRKALSLRPNLVSICGCASRCETTPPTRFLQRSVEGTIINCSWRLSYWPAFHHRLSSCHACRTRLLGCKF